MSPEHVRRTVPDEQLELWPEEPNRSRWPFYLAIAGVVVATAMLFAPLAFSADKPEGEGYWGVGHSQYHQLYKKMHNQNGTHCCNDGDCTPTQGKFLDNGNFAVMVNGHWKEVNASQRVVDAYGLTEFWSVCFDKSDEYVFCVIPENSGF